MRNMVSALRLLVRMGCSPLVAVVAAGLLVASCAGGGRVDLSERVVNYGEEVPKGGGSYKVGKPYQVQGQWFQPHEDHAYDRVGIASWYGDLFHGRRTANGEVFDMDALTAAHPTLPIPVLVEVTNLQNGRVLVVRVNDRGPYKANRVIDLSRKSAKLLGFVNKGTARVRVRYLRKAPMSGDDSLEQSVAASLIAQSGGAAASAYADRTADAPQLRTIGRRADAQGGTETETHAAAEDLPVDVPLAQPDQGLLLLGISQ